MSVTWWQATILVCAPTVVLTLCAIVFTAYVDWQERRK